MAQLVILVKIAVLIFSLSAANSVYSAPNELHFASVNVGVPYGYFDELGHGRGILFDILTHLAQDLKPTAKVSLVPFKRMLYGMNNGQYHCSLFFQSEMSIKRHHQIGLIAQKPVIIVSLSSNNKQAQATSLDDFEGQTVGMIRSGQYGGGFDQNNKIIKREFDNYEQALNLVKQGRLDAVIGPKEMILGVFDFKGEYLVVAPNEIWLQCAINSTVLQQGKHLTQIKQAYERLIKGHVIREIHNQYLKIPK